MFSFEKVEVILDQWKSEPELRHGSFAYGDQAVSFRSLVAKHFGQDGEAAYGVYVIRKETDGSIVYIGKGGTVGADGQFKGQDISGRLQNVRGGDTGADLWFRDLIVKVGPVRVEYLILSPPVAPAYVETVLLQSYLSEHGRLPLKNAAL